jgi:hypothetical protein
VPQGREEKVSRIRLEVATSEAAALRAESRQARRHAAELRRERNVLVETAARIVADFLAQRGVAVAEPVSARLRTTEHGSTGVDVSVTLEDPADIDAVRAVIDDHFGGDDGVDVLRIR